MKNSWSSLAVKMPLFILFVAVLPLLLYGTLNFFNNRSVLLQTQNRATVRTVELVAEQLEHHVMHFSDSLVLAAEHLALLEMPVDEQEWSLLDLLHQYESLVSLTLLDRNGQEQVKVSQEHFYSPADLVNQAGAKYMQAAESKTVFVSHPEYNELGGFVSQVSAPLFDPVTGNLAAVLLAEVSLRDMFAEIANITIGQNGLLYLVDDDGRVIFHPDTSLTFGKARITQNPAELVLKENNVVFMDNLFEVEVQASVVPVHGTTWYLIGERPLNELQEDLMRSNKGLFVVLGCLVGLIVLLGLFFSQRTTRPLKALAQAATKVTAGNFEATVHARGNNEIATVSEEFNNMVAHLREMTLKRERDDWNRDGMRQLDDAIRGKEAVIDIAKCAIDYLARYVDAPVAALYQRTEEGHYKVLAGYAHQGEASPVIQFRDGEGLVGQVGRDRQPLLLNEVPEDYLDVTSGLGKAPSASILILPLIANDLVVGVMEMGSFSAFSEKQQAFLKQAADAFGLSLQIAIGRDEVRKALIRTQRDSEKLQAQQEELQAMNTELEKQTQKLETQQEELRVTNEELEEQARRLQDSEEELQANNEELEEKTQSLQAQQEELKEKNSELELARQKLVAHARQLQEASRYKSEFLANMSHELRTPLNSLLILSQDLKANKDGNLTDDQVESAEVIYNSGNDLLQLINDILDLSKIEAGKMELRRVTFETEELKSRMIRSFRHMAEAKQLELEVDIDENAPEQVKSDLTRIEQVLRNLIGNALKFTQEGHVRVRMSGATINTQFGDQLPTPEGCFTILVEDTGIGIPQDKLDIIFEAFQQVDGSLSRQFSGTGLGLTISREMCQLLGGEISVFSEEDKGSTFVVVLPVDIETATTYKVEQKTLELLEQAPHQDTPMPAEPKPLQAEPAGTAARKSAERERPEVPTIADDRDTLSKDKPVVLIIEDDLKFARILANECRKKGLNFLHAADGQGGLDLADEYRPVAILLDIRLPGKDGIYVLETLKESTELRHIPVHVISAEDHAREVLSRGAVRFVRKPTSSKEIEIIFAELATMLDAKPKRLLVIDDDKDQRKSIVRLIGNGDVKSVEADSGAKAYELLQAGDIDCMILDLGLPDMSGFELLEKLEAGGIKIPPVIIYTGRDLTLAEEEILYRYSSSIIIKGIRSPERLLDETSLFLHRMVSKMPLQKQKIIASLHDGEPNFTNRKILLVDDDMRNVFAIGKILEQHGLLVLKAANGRKALEALENEPDVDLVLMDVMMPEMDGLEATKKIRAREQFKNLPIIALTAKAMPEDRVSCLEAGASDYLAKPVDIEQLLSLLRVWLYR